MSLIHHLREAMLAQPEQTLAELDQAISVPHDRQQLSSLLATEISARRALRTGPRGAYRYSLTTGGRLCAENPAYAHSRFNRRHRGKPQPRPPEAA